MTEVPKECEKCSYSMNIKLFGHCPFDDRENDRRCPRFIETVKTKRDKQ